MTAKKLSNKQLTELLDAQPNVIARVRQLDALADAELVPRSNSRPNESNIVKLWADGMLAARYEVLLAEKQAEKRRVAKKQRGMTPAPSEDALKEIAGELCVSSGRVKNRIAHARKFPGLIEQMRKILDGDVEELEAAFFAACMVYEQEELMQRIRRYVDLALGNNSTGDDDGE